MEVPIVVTETYDVRPGNEADFYSWATALIDAVSRSDSYLGGDVRDPELVDGRWQIVHRWADGDDAREWEASSNRERWLAAAATFARPHSTQMRAARAPAPAPFPQDPPAPVGRAEQLLPVEPREPAAAAGPPSPPPKWKMSIVTLMAVFPPVLFFNLTLIPQLQALSVVLRTLILCMAVTPIVTWVMMPRLQRLLKGWLTGARGPARARTEPLPAVQPVDQDPEPAENFPRFRPATVPAGVRDGRARVPSARVADLDPADPYLRRSR